MANKLFKSFFAIAMLLGSALGFVACEDRGDDVVEDPKVEISATSLNFTMEEGSQSVELTANADWKVEVEDADWVTVAPAAGTGDATLTVAVAMNDSGAVRTAVVKVIALHKEYGNWDTKKLTVSQSAGEEPPVEEVLLYGDNFDGEEATRTYGSGSSWPYIDQFPQFANAEGPASESVTYSGKGVSVRANSTSDSDYSDYAGSGSNNIFFGSSAYFQINNITLAEGQQNLKLTFGSEKYSQDGDSVFKNEEFQIYLSKDGNGWAELEEYTFAGTEGGRWNVATAEFTLNAVPETLYIKFVATVASVYRLDDVKLFAGNGGQAIDLDNIEAPEPVEVKKVTVAEFLAAAEDATIYELTGEITSVTNETYGNFYLKDATGEVLIYGLCSPTGEQKYWAESGAKVGDTITVQTVRSSYNGTPQGRDAIFVSLVPGTGTTPEPEPTPGDVISIADVLAMEQGATIGAKIEGVVVSNYELNNLTSKKGMYVQDETGALQFYLAANHEFAHGTEVQIDLTEATLGSYNGAVQVSGVALDKISVLSTGNTITPKSVTMADFLANKYEGQYIALEGVQVAASDLANTWVVGGAHTSINMEDANGNKFVVFSSKYASYGAETVAQGAGTIKGISSINNGTIQIIFAQASDYADLTGERFGDSGETPEPEPEPSIVVATVAEFLAAAEDDTIYELTGEITSVANTTYGNFDLTDATGTVYIYGLCSPTGETKYWAESGVKVGDTITIQTVRSSYNGSPQGKNAIYVSHISAEVEEPEPEEPETLGKFDSMSIFTANISDANKAYLQEATINGESCQVIKLGTSSVVGTVTSNAVGVSGDKTLSFYGVAWNGKSGKLTVSVDGTAVTTFDLVSNSGASSNPPYTITLDETSDYYSVSLTGLTESSTITLSSESGATRVILAGVTLK